MLNLNYNIQGRSRSILIIITLLGGFFSVFYYTVLFPDSRFNIPAVNYSVTTLYFLFFIIVYFIHDQQSPFYQSQHFTKVLNYIQSRPKDCKMKEKQTRKGLRLLITFDKVTSVDIALERLQEIE